MTEELTVRRSANFLEAEVDGELVALDVDRGACYGFNLSATRIWSVIEQPKTTCEIRQALLAEFEVDPQTCHEEMMELLRQLEGDGLVKLEPTS